MTNHSELVNFQCDEFSSLTLLRFYKICLVQVFRIFMSFIYGLSYLTWKKYKKKCMIVPGMKYGDQQR